MLFGFLVICGIAMTLMIYFGIFNINARYIFLLLLLLAIGMMVNYYDLDLKYLGFGKMTIWSATCYTVITVAGILFIKYSNLKNKVAKRIKATDSYSENIIFYCLASAPLQEFVFRAFPLAIFMKFGWNSMVAYILFSATCFAFAHLFLRNYYILVSTFVIGGIWAYVYFLFPDLMMVAISHIIFGLTLLYGRMGANVKNR